MEEYYDDWHPSVIQKIDSNYQIIDDGILDRKDFTFLFENEERKLFIPAESCSSINVYADAGLTSSFLKYINERGLCVNIFDRFGYFVGSFHSESHNKKSQMMLKQLEIYANPKARREIAVLIETASLHNQQENLRYYHKHRDSSVLSDAILSISGCIDDIKKCESIEKMMLIEARARQRYYRCFDEMINDANFQFEKRSKRPPLNPVNALIGFGNGFLYRRIANEIYKTALDTRIGFLHAANERSESLNLDIAEIFKPIIVDRAIFTAIHNKQLDAREHFTEIEGGGIYLNKTGKGIFIRMLEEKLHSKLKVKGEPMTYDRIIREEIRKLARHVEKGESYKPFKYT